MQCGNKAFLQNIAGLVSLKIYDALDSFFLIDIYTYMYLVSNCLDIPQTEDCLNTS